MKKIENRPKAPTWLQKNYKKWGKRWEEKIMAKKNTSFSWGVYNKIQINQLLLPHLKEITQNHCAFCDGYPMESRIPATIEHFRPKSQYPLLAYTWMNLFLCCGNCQKKGEKYDTKLLKPDQKTYDFYEYFVYNYATGELEANPSKSKENQERAKITITLYRLNDFGRPEDRKEVYAKYLDSNNPNTNDFSYRFMF